MDMELVHRISYPDWFSQAVSLRAYCLESSPLSAIHIDNIIRYRIQKAPDMSVTLGFRF